MRWRYRHDEALGAVIIKRGYYGPEFDVIAPDGTRYTGMIDLFHMNTDNNNPQCDWSGPFLQIALDRPITAECEGGNTCHLRMNGDGEAKYFDE